MELPGTFCETMEPEWYEPHIAVLGVKLNEVYYGMNVKILQVFHGDAEVGDTITVWGDNGALCRWYVGTWADGDTVVWGLHETDFLGNEITAGFPPDLEQPGDYHISICGTYWLPYTNGMITGPIAPGVTSATVVQFWPAIVNCLATGISENLGAGGLLIVDGEGAPWLSLREPVMSQLSITDASGRNVLTRNWDGMPLQLRGMAAGAYVVQVRSDDRYWVSKVALDRP